MTKNEFLSKLRDGLSDLSRIDVDRTIEFYKEVIDDRIEEGIMEEAAVAALGELDLIIENVRAENSAQTVPTVKKRPSEKAEPHPASANEPKAMSDGAKKALGILISIGSLLYSIIFYALIISLGMSAVVLGGVAISALPTAIINIFTGGIAEMFLFLGITAVSAALTIVFAVCTRYAAKYGRLISKWIVGFGEKVGK